VLPEYSYWHPYHLALSSRNGPLLLAWKLSCPVIFGAIDGDSSAVTFQNVAVIIDAMGNHLGNFPKQHPVPLLRDGRAGEERPLFPLDQGTLGVAICFDYDASEVTNSLVRSGATVLVAPNYDAMHWGQVQHLHHELLFRLRAVENDRWVLRASSSGRSESIDPHGRPSAEGVEIGAIGSVVVGYGHRDTQPLGSLAYFLGPIAALGTLVCATWFVWRRHRQQREPEPIVCRLRPDTVTDEPTA
jgi:predicted amidohydrolase